MDEKEAEIALKELAKSTPDFYDSALIALEEDLVEAALDESQMQKKWQNNV